jgi:lysozyme
VNNFIDTLVRLVGRKVVIYTSSSFWKSYLPKSEWADQCILWIDQPGSFFPGQLYPWSGWSFWQTSYKSVLPEISGEFGLNWFNGSADELRQLVAA